MSTTTDALGNLIVTEQRDERPTVVLFHEDPNETQKWSEMLRGTSDIRVAHDLAALDEVLKAKVDVLVAAAVSDMLVERLQTRRGIRFIHCSPSVGEATLVAAEHGMSFVHVDDVRELTDKVLDVAYPRSSMVRHQLRNLSVRWQGGMLCPLIDLSNEGFSFRVESGFPLESILPGTVLDEVEMFSRADMALGQASAIVRHVAPLTVGSGYAVGCQFRYTARNEAIGPVSLIQDRAQCAGVLRNALRTATLILEHVDLAEWEVQCRGGEVDTNTSTVTLRNAPGVLQPFDVVRGRFEHGGAVYRFTTAVVSREPFMIRLPARFEMSHNRSSARYQPPASKPVYVDLSSVLLGSVSTRSVRDVSATGFSLDLDPLTDLCPVGTLFDRVRIELDQEELVVRARVRNVTRLGHGGARCGIEFEGLTDALRSRLAEWLIAMRYPGLVDGRRISFDRLWKFFLETKFIYPEKEASLAPLKDQIQHTFEAVNSTPNKVFNSVVAVDNDVVSGYISGVRVYARSWLCQHLAAESGKHGNSLMTLGQLMNLGQAEYISQNPDLEYWKMYFRPENKWPARVFGGFARTISDPRLADLRTYSYLKLQTSAVFPTAEGMQPVEADDADRIAIERYFILRERGALLRSDDLSRAYLDLAEVDARFARLGLSRKRKVFVVRRGSRRLGFALAEMSSAGLNLSELLSSFRVFVLPDGEAEATAVRFALLGKITEVYRDFGRSTAVGLVPVAEQIEYDDMGLATQKRYTMFTCHRSLVTRSSDYLDRLVRTIEQRRKRRAKASE